MKRILYLDCISGASGDMIVGSLLDLGADFERLQQALDKLEMAGEFSIDRERVVRCGITSTKFHVRTAEEPEAPTVHTSSEPHDHGDHRDHDHHEHEHHHDHEHHDQDDHHEHGHHHDHHDHGDHHHHAHRAHRDIVEIIRRADLGARATDLALAMFRRIAVAEAKIHGVPVEEVHFHEVGAVDSIVDIVAIAVLVDGLSPDEIVSSAVPVGSGRVRTQHGLYPVPAPATAEILKGIPLRQDDINFELTTPTGAAAVAELATTFGSFPSIEAESIGYGAGTRDFPDRPNVFRAVIGSVRAASGITPRAVTGDAASGDEHVDGSMAKVEVNLDDVSGEILGNLLELLIAAGVNDVWYSPVYMKKSRPATMVQVLCSVDLLDRVTEMLFTETTTFGLRYYPVTVHRLARRWRSINTQWGPIRVKDGYHRGRLVQSSPEYEDCRRVSRETGVPFRVVFEAAQLAAGEKTAENVIPGGA